MSKFLLLILTLSLTSLIFCALRVLNGVLRQDAVLVVFDPH